VGAAKTFISARGTLSYREESSDQFKRIVRTATFTRLDGGEEIPRLLNADPLLWTGTLFVVTGVEEVATDRLARPQLLAQTWCLVPEPFEELIRAEQNIGRLVYRLQLAGIAVTMQPGGGMRIEGERRVDGEPV